MNICSMFKPLIEALIHVVNRSVKNSLALPSSSVERAKRGIVSRLWVLLITRGLVLLSDWEELEEARGRRLQTKTS